MFICALKCHFFFCFCMLTNGNKKMQLDDFGERTNEDDTFESLVDTHTSIFRSPSHTALHTVHTALHTQQKIEPDGSAGFREGEKVILAWKKHSMSYHYPFFFARIRKRLWWLCCQRSWYWFEKSIHCPTIPLFFAKIRKKDYDDYVVKEVDIGLKEAENWPLPDPSLIATLPQKCTMHT